MQLKIVLKRCVIPKSQPCWLTFSFLNIKVNCVKWLYFRKKKNSQIAAVLAQSIICFMNTAISGILSSPYIFGNIWNKNKHSLSLAIPPTSSYRTRNLISKKINWNQILGGGARGSYLWVSLSRCLRWQQSRILGVAVWRVRFWDICGCPNILFTIFSGLTHKPQVI